jgi:DNA-binding transcriptional regulator LsrR (DeoR family)
VQRAQAEEEGKRAHVKKWNIDMLAAAYLKAEGRQQKNIAYMLQLSEVTVSRHIDEARKEVLHEHVRFVRHNIPRRIMEKVRQRISPSDLQEQLDRLAVSNGRGRKVSLRVFNCGTLTNDEDRMQRLAELAAPVIRGLLLRAGSCGVTWGGMLKVAVSELRHLSFPPPGTNEIIRFIPLSGEPLGKERGAFSSSSLARDLGTIVNGDQYDAPSLAMVPAFIPDVFQKHESEGVWKLIGLVKTYREIFGRRRTGNAELRAVPRGNPLAKRLEMVLTSVGSATKPLGFGRGVLFKLMSVSYKELKSLIIAEVGGVCIPRSDLTQEQLDRFNTVQTSWTGLRLEHLAACAARGVDPLKGPPGVVVVSGGTGRASAICELIKLGLINHLIIDDVLAEELEKASRSTRHT